MAMPTLANLLILDTPGAADIEVSDLLNKANIINRFAAIPASDGTLHKYVKETGAPTVGFRAPNNGLAASDSTELLVSITLKILSANTEADKALADAHKKGAEAYIARKVEQHFREALFQAEKQMLYGTGIDSDGFVGLAENSSVANSDSLMVVDAGGTTVDTASSVWFFVTTEDESNICVVGGNDGKITIGDTGVQMVEDGSVGRYPIYFTPCEGWLGCQVGSKYSVGRIVNLTEDSGKGLTDTLLSQMLQKFPMSHQPTFIAMSRRSRGQLQRSRTTYSPTGAPAPLPSEYEGIPIVTTESITDTEALVAAA